MITVSFTVLKVSRCFQVESAQRVGCELDAEMIEGVCRVRMRAVHGILQDRLNGTVSHTGHLRGATHPPSAAKRIDHA